jgi:flagellar motor component MotA
MEVLIWIALYGLLAAGGHWGLNLAPVAALLIAGGVWTVLFLLIKLGAFTVVLEVLGELLGSFAD